MKGGLGDVPALPKVVLFDMDDTLFDFSLTCRDALARLRSVHPRLRSRPLHELWREYVRLLETVHADIASGALSIDLARAQRFERLAKYCGSSVSPEEARDWSQEYRRHYQSLRRLVPGARRLLERLHERTMLGIVSNNQVAEQEEKVTRFGLDGLLDFLVISEGVGVAKPDPRIFGLALDRASARPREAVMVGDSWENDVLGARGAGVPAVWFNRFGRSPPSVVPVPQITSFRSPGSVEAILARARLR